MILVLNNLIIKIRITEVTRFTQYLANPPVIEDGHEVSFSRPQHRILIATGF